MILEIILEDLIFADIELMRLASHRLKLPINASEAMARQGNFE